jgi:hypothetical protein
LNCLLYLPMSDAPFVADIVPPVPAPVTRGEGQ